MKLINWLQLLLLILLIGTGLVYSQYRNLKIEQCSNEFAAKVVDKYRKRKSSHMIKYKYIVNNQTYFSSQTITKKVQLESILVGDMIIVDVSCSNPNISEMKDIE